MSITERHFNSQKFQGNGDAAIEPENPNQDNLSPILLPASDILHDGSHINSGSLLEIDRFSAVNKFRNFLTLLQLQPESTSQVGVYTSVQERQFMQVATIDESVLATMRRDLNTVGNKLSHILWPIDLRMASNTSINEGWTYVNDDNDNSDNLTSPRKSIRMILEWDLWGPLVLVLGYSLLQALSQSRRLLQKSDETPEIFTGVFTFLCLALCVLALNNQLLAPSNNEFSERRLTLSFFQRLSILGYCFAPVVLGSLLSFFVSLMPFRMLIQSTMLCWSIYCVYLLLNFMQQGGENKLFLSVYPVVLVFGTFSWISVIG